MGIEQTDTTPAARSNAWKWWVCGLLLLATMINYMDRQTISQTSARIIDELELNNDKYGTIETAFSYAFAVGALIVGWTADKWNVRWVYAASVLLWSAAGFCTGFASALTGLILCRFALGLFESGNWPCALRTTQRILRPDERTAGNGILQSGAAIGAIATPVVVQLLVSGPGTWKYPFFVIGAVGALWVFFWVATIRAKDLAPDQASQVSAQSGEGPGFHESFWTIFRDVRFWVIMVVGISINLTWHFFRAWLPLFLKNRGYEESATNWFTSCYYVATDAGALTAGFVSLYLVRRGLTIYWSRLAVFFACALLTMLSLAVAVLPKGPLLLCMLLVIGFGALGLFPPYYSFGQELTTRHQGKLTGLLSCTVWLPVGTMQKLIGRWLDETKDYSTVVAIAGLMPLVGFLALVCFWRLARPVTTRPSGEQTGLSATAADPRGAGQPSAALESAPTDGGS